MCLKFTLVTRIILAMSDSQNNVFFSLKASPIRYYHQLDEAGQNVTRPLVLNGQDHTVVNFITLP